ncbi:MAG: hypothetical protein ACE5DX_03150 [Candidatus Dojkabacteria bacterium]
MPELLRRKPAEVRTAMNQLEFELPDGYELGEVYPIFYRNRFVFRVNHESGTILPDRVIKIRPSDEAAQVELAKLRALVASYSPGLPDEYRSIHSEELNGGMISMNMPYMGENINELASHLGEIDYYLSFHDDEARRRVASLREEFEGFSREVLSWLFNDLRCRHLRFAKSRGIIHGDLFQHGDPNNIVFHPTLQRLFTIDAEALGDYNNERIGRFHTQFGSVMKWAYPGPEDSGYEGSLITRF